jgi:trehalose/maltose transport system permease protein
MALLILAGLQMIPGDMYEAGAIDGATGVRKFFYLTLPFIMPTLLVALIFRTLDALRVFDIFYIMVGGAGDMATMATYNRLQLIDFFGRRRRFRHLCDHPLIYHDLCGPLHAHK